MRSIVVGLLAVAPAILQAQEQRPTTELFLSGGAQYPVFSQTGGLTFHGGVVRQMGRLGLRLGLQHSGVSYDYRNPTFNFSRSANFTMTGVSAELTFDLTRSNFRPYLLAGVGYSRFDGRSFDNISGPTAVDYRSRTFSAGLGFRYRVGGVQLFTEARFIGPFGYHVPTPLVPITFGIRFE
jgi:opacity protein-like surface antigen